MADIPQTSRTLALDQFNPQMPDLLTEIGDVKGIDSLDDDRIAAINDKLLVRSFPEFLEKMQPTVYSFFDAANQCVRYSLEKPESLPDNLITEIPIGMSNDVFKMLTTMIDAKRSQGTINQQFGFESILDLISPKSVIDDIRQTRKELQTNYAVYESLPEGDPKRDEYAKTLNNLFDEARANYSNTMALLPLAIEDSKERLLLGGGEEGGASERIAAGIAKFDADGSLKILEAPKVEETALAITEGETSTKLAAILEDDYAETTEEEEPSDFVKSLVIRTFSPLSTSLSTEVDVQQEAANYNNYLQLYTDSKAEFIKVVKPLLEKMLGVREFFGQYTVKSKAGMRPTLLLANCTPEMLAKSNNTPRLRTFLNTVNNKNEYTNTIWQAIFPNAAMDKAGDKKSARKVFDVSDELTRKDVNSLEVLGQLAAVMADYSVETFFSFETGEKTSFDSVAREGISAIMDRCEPLMNKDFSAYAYPCAPNATVIPKNRSGVITGKLMEVDGDKVTLSENEENLMRFWIEGVYIPAAYVAAGVTAAWQCPEYLKEKFRKNVHPRLPGVRYDVEQGNNALVTTTTLAREIAGFTASVKEDINNQNFGFIFASEKLSDKKGTPVNHLTVYKARSLKANDNGFESIFQTRTITYFQRVLRQVTGDNKEDNIKYFFSTAPDSQMSIWNGQKEYVNAIMRPEDNVTYEMEGGGRNCDIQFNFGGESRNMQVTIERGSVDQAS